MGDAQAFSYELCQSIKAILAEDGEKPEWSDRTIAAIEGIRQDYHWLDNESTVCLPGRNGEFEWWTFGGRRANATLGNALAIELGTPTIATNFMIEFDSTVQLEMLNDALEAKEGKRQRKALLESSRALLRYIEFGRLHDAPRHTPLFRPVAKDRKTLRPSFLSRRSILDRIKKHARDAGKL